ncbi:MAG: Na+/H+ antiporter subunit E [Traorella sp.]
MYILYFLLWIIYNGSFTIEIGIIGLIITTLIFIFTCKYMGYSIKKELKFYLTGIKLLKFFIILVVEIVKANFNAIHFILSESEEIEPVLVHFTMDFKTNIAKVLLANAITLTPGTITAELEGDDYTIHALDKSFACGLDSSVLVKCIRDIENIWIED